MSYVTVSLKDFESTLTPKGFVLNAGTGKQELVFDRPHERDPRIKVRVFTSIPRGAAETRGVGEDAIRVCLVFSDGQETRGLRKCKRVFRTGSPAAVLERVLERSREMWHEGRTAFIPK